MWAGGFIFYLGHGLVLATPFYSLSCANLKVIGVCQVLVDPYSVLYQRKYN